MTHWTPTLVDDDAVVARETVARSAAALFREFDRGAQDLSLARGSAGVAIFLDYAAATGIWPPGRRASEALIHRAVKEADARALGPGLYEGLTGIVWALAHTQPPEVVTLVASDVDAGLEGLLGRLPPRVHFDLISGVVGYGVYALERAADPSGAALAASVVRRLRERARRLPEGLAWAAASAGEADANGPHLNLGMAHGSPGVVAYLASCHEAGVERASVEELLEPAVRWVLAQREGENALPYWIEPKRRAGRARLAWCYGSPGAAIALLRAARAVGRDDWERAALDLALWAADHPHDDSGVIDRGLCHGSMGLAHQFGRLYAMTNDERFAAAARAWIGWDPSAHRAASDGFGLLTGVAGIGLALAGATSNAEPAWDRALLLSGPSTAALPLI